MNANDLNTHPGLVLWFDDLGSGNEEFRFLSNFYRGEPLILPGVTWEGQASEVDQMHEHEVKFPTGEHAFAAMKFWRSDPNHFFRIVKAEDPNDAKALGRSRRNPLREDWEIVKLDVMAAVVRAKFTLDREEGDRLLATGDKLLVEGTFWHDDVWGVDLTAKSMPGRNWLGTLLMARRAELRAVAGDLPAVRAWAHGFAANTGAHNADFAL